MSKSISLRQLRTLTMDVLRAVNDLDADAPSELQSDLHRIRHHLHCALKDLDRATDPDPVWPRLAARA